MRSAMAKKQLIFAGEPPHRKRFSTARRAEAPSLACRRTGWPAALYYTRGRQIGFAAIFICFAVIIQSQASDGYTSVFTHRCCLLAGPLQWLTRILMCYPAIPLGGPPLPHAAGRGVAQPRSAPCSGPGGRRVKA